MLHNIQVRVKEVVECFTDHYDYDSETHFTHDFRDEQENVYTIQVEVDEDGNIIDKDLDDKVWQAATGDVISFEILY